MPHGSLFSAYHMVVKTTAVMSCGGNATAEKDCCCSAAGFRHYVIVVANMSSFCSAITTKIFNPKSER